MMSHFLMRLGVAFYPGGCGQVLISSLLREWSGQMDVWCPVTFGGSQEALVLDVGNLGETWPDHLSPLLLKIVAVFRPYLSLQVEASFPCIHRTVNTRKRCLC